IIGDDVGDHISHKNCHFAELTAAYWAWKNMAQLGTPDHVGLFHYRRYLNFGERLAGSLQFDRSFSDFSDNTRKRHGWDDNVVRQYCAKNDILLPEIES